MNLNRGKIKKWILRHRKLFTFLLALFVVVVVVLVFEYEYIPSFQYKEIKGSSYINAIGISSSDQTWGGGLPYYIIPKETSTAYLNQTNHISYMRLSVLSGVFDMPPLGGNSSYVYFADLSLSGHLYSNLHPKALLISATLSAYAFSSYIVFCAVENLDNLSLNPYSIFPLYTSTSHSDTGILAKFSLNNIPYFDLSENFYDFNISSSGSPILSGHVGGMNAHSDKPSILTISISAELIGLGKSVIVTDNATVTIWPIYTITAILPPKESVNEIQIKNLSSNYVCDISSSQIHYTSRGNGYGYISYNAKPLTPYLFCYEYPNGTKFIKPFTTGGAGQMYSNLNLSD